MRRNYLALSLAKEKPIWDLLKGQKPTDKGEISRMRKEGVGDDDRQEKARGNF